LGNLKKAPTGIRTRNASLEARNDHPFHHRGRPSRLDRENTPTRNRTWDTSLGPRHDHPLHHRGDPSGRQGIRTLKPVRAHSLAVRPGEPYPATFRITFMRKNQWTGRGVEPRFPGCKPGVFPLDQPPMKKPTARQRSARESNPDHLHTREACRQKTPADRSVGHTHAKRPESSRRESNPPSLFVREESCRWTTGR
jgi:hypothetical protein